MQLEVFWSLLLQADSEGPTYPHLLCSYAHFIFKSALVAHYLLCIWNRKSNIEGCDIILWGLNCQVMYWPPLRFCKIKFRSGQIKKAGRVFVHEFKVRVWSGPYRIKHPPWNLFAGVPVFWCLLCRETNFSFFISLYQPFVAFPQVCQSPSNSSLVFLSSTGLKVSANFRAFPVGSYCLLEG